MAPFPISAGPKKKPKAQKNDKARTVSAAEVAQQAVERLNLPRPVIRSSPAEDFTQIVHVPTWMWLEPSSWRPVSRSASAGGVTVLATARPRRAEWTMGDGTTVVCRGPGTPYSSRFDADSSSPDCGHTYRVASLSEPGGRYRVNVRVTWDVSWRGGGGSGVVPGMVRSASRDLLVDEVQAVVTD